MNRVGRENEKRSVAWLATEGWVKGYLPPVPHRVGVAGQTDIFGLFDGLCHNMNGQVLLFQSKTRDLPKLVLFEIGKWVVENKFDVTDYVDVRIFVWDRVYKTNVDGKESKRFDWIPLIYSKQMIIDNYWSVKRSGLYGK